MEDVTSAEVTRLISYEPDAFLQRIVLTWPPYFETPMADRLGFAREASIEDIIRAYIEEEGIVINDINTR